MVDALASDICAGRRPAGTWLPTQRELATREGILTVTELGTTPKLEVMGLVSGERGMWHNLAIPPRMASISPPLLLMPSISAQLSSAPWPARSLALRALREFATTGDLEALLRYQIHGGRSRERAVVADHLRTCGLRVDADDVVTGAQYGLAVTAMALVRPGDIVAVDALTYPGFKALAQSMRFELAPVARRLLQGLTSTRWSRPCSRRRIRGLRDAPFHNPLGWLMDEVARPRLIEIARRFEPLIIEGVMSQDIPDSRTCDSQVRLLFIWGFVAGSPGRG